MLIHFDSSGDQFEATDSPYHIIIMSESNCTLEPKPAKNVGSVEKPKVSGRNPRFSKPVLKYGLVRVKYGLIRVKYGCTGLKKKNRGLRKKPEVF